jgi:hypothetical protein
MAANLSHSSAANRKSTIVPRRRLMGALNMNSLRSRERAQANGAVEVSSKLEGEIHEVISRSATTARVPQQNDNELAASNIGSLLQCVSGTSVQEIEKLITELQILQEMLQNEATRVQREIVGYAALIQSARQSTRTVSESLSFLQSDGGSELAREAPPHRPKIDAAV